MKPLLAGNWKMHRIRAEAEDLARGTAGLVGPMLGSVDVALFPPFTAIAAAADAVRGTGVTVGAQNVHPQEEGAFTGEISPRMLLDVGATRVLVGHSERRHGLGEGDTFLNAKMRAAIRHRLLPLLCVGETLPERDAGRFGEVVERQLREGLAQISASDAASVTIAYEPVWAIGTGRNASPAQVAEVHARIRALLSGMWGDAGGRVRILYGGSVKPENARALLATPDVNGALVGGASLDPRAFAAIVQAASA